MALLNRQFAYSKIANIDSEELQSRRAQFLIYKSLQKVGSNRSTRPSWLRVKMNKFRIKIGKRLKILRKRSSSSLFAAKTDLYKQIAYVLKSCKFLIQGKHGQIVRTLPPVF